MKPYPFPMIWFKPSADATPIRRPNTAGRSHTGPATAAILAAPATTARLNTKMAVEGISESLQAEVAPYGIRVIAIQAGTILTPIWGKNPPPPEDTPYPEARDFLLKVLSHQLMNTGVPAETVADVIGDALAAVRPRRHGAPPRPRPSVPRVRPRPPLCWPSARRRRKPWTGAPKRSRTTTTPPCSRC